MNGKRRSRRNLLKAGAAAAGRRGDRHGGGIAAATGRHDGDKRGGASGRPRSRERPDPHDGRPEPRRFVGGDSQRALRRGRAQRRLRSRSRARSSTCAGRQSFPDRSRATRTSSASRTAPVITSRSGSSHRTSPKSWRCSPPGAKTCPRASSSPRWAPVPPGCSPSRACRRSPSSTRRCPTGRYSCTRAVGGPARTNTLGKTFFESATAPLAGPCVVGAEGELVTVAGVNHANRALYHLRVRQTFEDKKRSALDAMAFSASVGITTNLDQTLVAVRRGRSHSDPNDPRSST